MTINRWVGQAGGCLTLCRAGAAQPRLTGRLRAPFSMQGACQFGSDVGEYYAAWSDKAAEFAGSCGTCVEVACLNKDLSDRCVGGRGACWRMRVRAPPHPRVLVPPWASTLPQPGRDPPAGMAA
jgi:hypothetical protein